MHDVIHAPDKDRNYSVGHREANLAIYIDTLY